MLAIDIFVTDPVSACIPPGHQRCLPATRVCSHPLPDVPLPERELEISLHTGQVWVAL